MALKDLAKNAMELNDEEIELVSGGAGLPDGWQEAEVKCPYCPAAFRYFITNTGNEDTKQIAEGKRVTIYLTTIAALYIKAAAQLTRC